MEAMLAKFGNLWPEIALLTGATICLMIGLSPSAAARRATAWVAGASLAVAGGLVLVVGEPEASGVGLAGIVPFLKLAVVGVGLILLLVAAGVPDRLRQTREAEAAREFEPGDIMRGEFFGFFLFSLTGLMLTVGADDLVWLFLALELTSLPTYVMVATARDRAVAQESGVKYFFLGALAAAVFLYGFALIYGATGFTTFAEIASVAQQQAAVGALSPLLITGMVLAIVGVCFKIAAFPMHFYAADVYEGANTAVTAFLAFVPKAAGIVALVLLLGLVGRPLPGPIEGLIWAIAVVTMTLGNVLGLLQQNVKRVLAYSSIAHSGYLLVGLLVGPAAAAAGGIAVGDGVAAVLFYLVAYGLATIASFAVLGCLQARGDEAQTYDDIAGLYQRQPVLAAVMLVGVLSLLGLPPLVGFLGKIYLFGSALTQGYVALVVIAVLNSAISAVYYLRIAAACFFGSPSGEVTPLPAPARRWGAVIAAAGAVILGFWGGGLVDSSQRAAEPRGVPLPNLDVSAPPPEADTASAEPIAPPAS